MTASPNRRYNGHHKAIEEKGNQGILGEEIWRKKCGQQDTSTAGGRRRLRLPLYLYPAVSRRRPHKTELDMDTRVVCGLCSTGSDNAEVKC